MALTDKGIRKLRTCDKDQILRDSRGLYLTVRATAAPSPIKRAPWVCRITRKGKTSKSTLGYWPEMTADKARRARDRLTGVNVDLGVTLDEVLDEYRRLVTDRQKSGYQAEVYLRHISQRYGARRIATVTRADLVSAVQGYSRERGERSADRYLSQLRGVFTLAAELGYIEVSPLVGVTKRITGYTPKSRDRILTDDEIRALFAWDHRNAAMLRFLLLTGLRIAEAQKGHRDGDRWVVPAQYSKNGAAYWVHLTPSAVAELGTPFDNSPTAVQSWLKRKLERDGCVDRWTPHDLRRTAATRMSGAGVEPFIVERCLGHTLQGVMAVYNRHEYAEERTEAALRLERAILGVLK